jgi:hypothetical protein
MDGYIRVSRVMGREGPGYISLNVSGHDGASSVAAAIAVPAIERDRRAKTCGARSDDFKLLQSGQGQSADMDRNIDRDRRSD